jgi:hypothetical protein
MRAGLSVLVQTQMPYPTSVDIPDERAERVKDLYVDSAAETLLYAVFKAQTVDLVRSSGNIRCRRLSRAGSDRDGYQSPAAIRVCSQT